MSLLSPFSPFSPGEGVGSKALTHQQVPFSPFISSLSSQLPLFLFSSLLSAPLFSILLHCLFTSSPLHCFPLPQFVFLFLSHCLFFSFSFLDLHPLVLSSPIILFFCLIIAVVPFPPLVSLSHPFPYSHCPLMPSPHTLLHLYSFSSSIAAFPPSTSQFHSVSFHFFSPFSHLLCPFSFPPSVSLFWLIFALLVFRVHLEKWRGRRGEGGEEGGENKAP